jgi:hypothetical protein
VNALVAATTAPRIVVQPGPIIVQASPVTVHTAHVVHTTDTTATVIAVVGVLLTLAALGWQAWTFQRSGSRVRVGIARGLAGARARDHDAAGRDAEPDRADALAGLHGSHLRGDGEQQRTR